VSSASDANYVDDRGRQFIGVTAIDRGALISLRKQWLAASSTAASAGSSSGAAEAETETEAEAVARYPDSTCGAEVYRCAAATVFIAKHMIHRVPLLNFSSPDFSHFTVVVHYRSAPTGEWFSWGTSAQPEQPPGTALTTYDTALSYSWRSEAA
jgi:hypothetical protein